MRHRHNRLLELNTGVKSKSVFMRMQLSSLLRAGKLTTTPKRAKVLKAYTDHFFSTLMNILAKYEEKDAQREAIRYVKSVVYGEEEGKKVITTFLPKYKEEKRKSGFTTEYKLGYRVGDASQKIMLKLA
ncbi:MAG: L17 family ribosomal protein [bacterium]|nr:L17 family ribosomal protein [bacterium]